MINTVMIVGKLKDINGEKLTLTVSNPHKEKDSYKTYDITILVWGGIRNNITNYCETGCIIGIKGRIGKFNKIIAEKVIFLSTRKKEN